MAQGFGWHEHKSSAPQAAAAFYQGLLPWRIDASPDGEARLLGQHGPVGVFRHLPAPLVAQGVPAHWLPHLRVPELLPAVAAYEAHGASRLGPPLGEESQQALLREPWGSVVGLRQGAAPQAGLAGVWHALQAQDEQSAAEAYQACFGWGRGALLPLQQPPHRVQLMHADPEGPATAAMLPGASLPGVHPHWVVVFLVPDLDAALGLALSREARLGPDTEPLPQGWRMAYLEDPWGAAFGLAQAQA